MIFFSPWGIYARYFGKKRKGCRKNTERRHLHVFKGWVIWMNVQRLVLNYSVFVCATWHVHMPQTGNKNMRSLTHQCLDVQWDQSDVITIILTSTVYHCVKKIYCLKPHLKRAICYSVQCFLRSMHRAN